MSHFYGTLQGTRGEATRCGDKRSGMTVYAASWRGAIRVRLYVDEHGRDCFTVDETTWHGAGQNRRIESGVIGERLVAERSTETADAEAA